MQRRKFSPLCVAALVSVAVICFTTTARAYPNGVSGASGKSGSTCTMCHSSGTALPTVAISGPMTVSSGSTNTYTLSNNGSPNSGLDVGASAGTFTAGSTTQVMSGEITHKASLSTSPLSWTFSWTAPTVTTPTTVMMYGASISGGYGGSTGSTVVTITVNPAATAPSITSQPGNQTVTAGQTASFSVTASGTAPLSYQWRKNGVNIAGATSSSYTTPATTTTDSGSSFSVVVSNSAGSATSNNATLTVNAAAVAPSITSQPSSQTVTAGQTASFSVTASGTAPLTYQWRKNGTNITGATSSSYTTPATTTTDSGSAFSVVVTNSAGSATSNAATLTVNAAAVAPSITSQPSSQTVTAGQTATFAVGATGTAPMSYQWKKNGTNISGATSSSYTTPATATTDSGSTFSVSISNSAGSVTSNSAALTVNQASVVAPSITTQPVSQAVSAGQTATFSVLANGTAPMSYQWKRNGTNITGATASSYTTAATTTSDSGSTFSVLVSNTAGSATSNNATLTVNSSQPPSGYGRIVLSTDRLVFYSDGSSAPSPKVVKVTSSARTTMNFTVDVYGGSWISVNPTAGATPGQLTVSAYPNGLTAGTYSCVIKVSANGTTKRVYVVLVIARGSDDGEEDDASGTRPFHLDPGAKSTADAAWLDGFGVPVQSKKDPTNQGLVLTRNPSGSKAAIAGAVIKGAAGSQLSQLSFDLRSDSECSTQAPQFVVVTADDVVHRVSCASGTIQPLSVTGWQRVSFDPAQQLTPAVAPGTAVKTIALVIDHPVGSGMAVLDDINVNGRYVVRQ